MQGEQKESNTEENVEMRMPEEQVVAGVEGDVQTPANSGNNMKTVIVLVVVIIIVIAGAFLYLTMSKMDSTDTIEQSQSMDDPETIAKDPYGYLMENSSNFKSGQKALSARSYQEARVYFTAALAEAQTPAEVGQIGYKLAVAESWDNDPVAAVQRLKEIALNNEHSDQQRAYAIMRIGEIYHTFNSKKVSNEIFLAGDFFEEEITQGDGVSNASLIRLYEYGSTFKPVAVSELRAAWYYTREIKNIERQDEITDEDFKKIDEYFVRIDTAIERADADYEATRSLENVGGLGPRILVLKATVLGELAERGKVDMEDTIEAFERALVASQIAEGSDAKIRYQFARFLMRTDPETNTERIGDILLAYTENKEVYENMLKFFAQHATENPLGSRSTIVGLGRISSHFATLLIELGYPPSEFSGSE